jgi:hypothetical protein
MLSTISGYYFAGHLNAGGPPVTTVVGPACFNDTGVNIYTVTFSSPVTGFTLASAGTFIDSASYGVRVQNIIQISPTTYTIEAVLGGIPYATTTAPAVMNGITGLTEIFAGNGSTTGYPGDDSVIQHTLPFNIAFPTSPTASVSGNVITIGTNSFIALGVYSGNGLPPSATLPPLPAIFIGAQDSGTYKMYAGSRDGNQTYIIRWQGTVFYTQNVYNRAWECKFYANDPTKFSISLDPVLWEVPNQGSYFVKNASAVIYPNTGGFPIAQGQTMTAQAGQYSLTIPAAAAMGTSGKPSLASNTVSLLKC